MPCVPEKSVVEISRRAAPYDSRPHPGFHVLFRDALCCVQEDEPGIEGIGREGIVDLDTSGLLEEIAILQRQVLAVMRVRSCSATIDGPADTRMPSTDFAADLDEIRHFNMAGVPYSGPVNPRSRKARAGNAPCVPEPPKQHGIGLQRGDFENLTGHRRVGA